MVTIDSFYMPSLLKIGELQGDAQLLEKDSVWGYENIFNLDIFLVSKLIDI